MTKTYLLTGAAGFIGSHVAERLLDRGDVVVGLDNFDPVYPASIKTDNIASARSGPRYEFVDGDIRDTELLRSLMQTHAPDAVIHLAARAGVRPSVEDPMSYLSVNVSGTGVVLEQARLAGVPHVVLASSSSVYGATSTPPFRESEQADRPSSMYAATKRANEVAAYAYHHLHGMTTTCLRFFTVYGPRQRPEMAIHKFARLIYTGEQVPLFGDGSARRDFTYIDDIVTGVVAAVDRPLGFRIYNLGTSETVEVRAVIDMLSARLGKPAYVHALPPQDGDVPVTHADVTFAANELDYRPSTDIGTGLDSFVTWFEASMTGTSSRLGLAASGAAS